MNSKDRRIYLRHWRRMNQTTIEEILKFIRSPQRYELSHVDSRTGCLEMKEKKLAAFGKELTASSWRTYLAQHGVVDIVA